MNVVFVGTGYVGLMSDTYFAEMGVNVTCVNVNRAEIESLQKGEFPIYEPGLDEIVLCKCIGGVNRIGTKFLYPGCGYGGKCASKEVNAFIIDDHNIYDAKKLTETGLEYSAIGC